MSRTRFSWIRSLGASLLVHASLAAVGVILLKPPALPDDGSVQVELFSEQSSLLKQNTRSAIPTPPRPQPAMRAGVQQPNPTGSPADSMKETTAVQVAGTRFGRGKPRSRHRDLSGEDSANLRKATFNHRRRNSLERRRTSANRQSLDNRRRVTSPEPTPFFRSSIANSSKITRHSRTRAAARNGGRPRLLDDPAASESRPDHGKHGRDTADEPNAPTLASAKARPQVDRANASTATRNRRRQTEDRTASDSASSRREPDLADMAAPQDKPLARNRDLGRGWGTRAAWLGDAAATGNKPLWLNTADSRYVRYFSVIHKKVQPLWHFPRQLEARLEQGEVLVQFTILRDGRIKALKVKRSSGFPAFDRIAVSAVRKAAPFQAIPEDLGTELQVICPFEFNNPLIR